jgi:uncharacterized protein
MTPRGFALASIAGAFMLTSVGAASAAPSWCSTQQTFDQAEKTICATQSLWALDTELNDTYEGAEYMLTHAGGAQVPALKSSQAQWLTDVRNPCGNSVVCLTNAYHARIDVLLRIRDRSSM